MGRFLYVLIVFSVCVMGCEENKAGQVLVRGKLVMLGKPLSRCSINLRPVDGTAGGGAIAATDREGNFELMNRRGEKGTYPGEYTLHLMPGPADDSANTASPKIPSLYLSPTGHTLILKVLSEDCFLDIQLAEKKEDAKVTSSPLDN